MEFLVSFCENKSSKKILDCPICYRVQKQLVDRKKHELRESEKLYNVLKKMDEGN